jgi:hypothetical protein
MSLTVHYDLKRDEILRKIQYAKEYTPHKVEYYKEMLKEYDLKYPVKKSKKK